MTSTDKLKGLLFLPRAQRESPEVVSAIRQIVAEDPEAMHFFVRWSHFEASLLWYVNEFGTDRNVVVTHVRKEVRQDRLIRFLVMAASAVLVVMIGFQVCIFTIRYSVSPLQVHPIVGRIAEVDGVIWPESRQGTQTLVRQGDRFFSRQGRFVVHMDSGALVACSGPVEMQVMNSMQLRLHDGAICIQVPERARGFEVQAKDWSIVDLGTIFGIRTSRNGSSEVHVMKGLVQARSDVVGQQEIIAGQGAGLAANGQITGLFTTDPGPFTAQLASLAGVAGSSKNLVVLNNPPRSVKFNGHVLRDQACLFREQEQPLPANSEIMIFRASPGIYSSKNLPERTTIPSGTMLTTYLLHAQNSGSGPVSGHVTFDGVIAGLALSSPDLNLTDAHFGHPDVLYPASTDPHFSGAVRGTLVQESTDFIEISPDLKTLRFKLSCATAIKAFDQIRIFVLPPRN